MGDLLFSLFRPVFHAKIHQSRVYMKLEDMGLYTECKCSYGFGSDEVSTVTQGASSMRKIII